VSRDRLSFPLDARMVAPARFTAHAVAAAANGDTVEADVELSGMAVPWNVTADLNWWGDTFEFAAGSITVAHADRVPFLLDHGNHAMGYGRSFTDDGTGLQASLTVPRAELGDVDTAKAVRQMTNGVRSALSVGAVIEAADVVEHKDHDHYVVTAARLVELSSVLVPRFDDARLSSVAASALTRGNPFMTTTAPHRVPGVPDLPARAPVRLADDPADDDTADDDTADDDDDAGSTDVNAARMGRRPATSAAGVGLQRRRGTAVDTSLAGVARLLASTGGDPRLVRAALSNITTADVFNRPQYVDELLGLLKIGTPVLSAFRQSNLTSNPVVFPKWTQLPLVDKVAVEKTAIPSGPATIGSMSITADTYAGGNDVSVQTIDWSSPDFLAAYFEACTEVYGQKIESAFEAGILGWATAMTPPAGAGLVDIIGQAIGAVAGKGLPGSLLLIVAGDVFGQLFVELAGQGPGLFGLVNADFPTPRVIVAPFFPAGQVVTAMSGAAISFQNAAAPIRLRAVDVSLLGVDVGVYGYLAAAALWPGALLKTTYTPAAGTFDIPDTRGLEGGDLLHDRLTTSESSTPSSSTRKSASTS
jgi:phage head maturation protease